MICDHPDFVVGNRVHRLTRVEGGPVIGFSLETIVDCASCGTRFRFLGLEAGSHPSAPRVSADALELRAPIEPAIGTEILGRLIGPSGRA